MLLDRGIMKVAMIVTAGALSAATSVAVARREIAHVIRKVAREAA